MGTFIYGKRAASLQLPDRTLAHLQTVVSIKLRRRESFMLNLILSTGTNGYQSYWLHPTIPVQFLQTSREEIRLNRTWVERLLRSASAPDGLWLMPETAQVMTGPTELTG